ncbi:amino acid transporter protein [Klebsormidium nitens]|uniref:Amino acid transporter protein n=1 Tax=Klebsormidium nitens TaxID=105231 RepID=A0A1Y1HV80_KLENI|nr:amino acid transporter protein [Klebsormidium nitens]|eukprot:GAQ81099.1 amino acid transporter protein [Klebsormidium nitens]
MEGAALVKKGEVSSTPAHFKATKAMAIDSGEKRLRELGYKQELFRALGAIANFAIGYTIIGVLMGVTGLYGWGFQNGGPVSVVWGWFLTSIFCLFIASSMAELSSSLPTAGGLYPWFYVLAGPTWGPFWSWITGWYNFLGFVCGLAVINNIAANIIATQVVIATGPGPESGYVASKGLILAIMSGLCIIQATINTFNVRILAVFEKTVLCVELAGLVVIVATLLFRFCTQAIGQAAVHMSEETVGSDVTTPVSIISAVGAAGFFGWIFIIVLTFCIQDPATILDPQNATAGRSVVGQIFYDAFLSKGRSYNGAIALLTIPLVTACCSGVPQIAACSRVLFAMSRDKAVPFSGFVHWSPKGSHTPVAAVWISSLLSFCFALFSLKSVIAFNAVTTCGSISFHVAYIVPICLRLVCPQNFKPGPFNMGR